MAGSPILDVTGQWIHEQVEAQPWWKTYSNTVTTAVGCAVTLAAWIASQEWARDDARVQAVVLALGFLGTVVGVKSTPNGWSPSQLAQVTNARAAFISDTACAGGAGGAGGAGATIQLPPSEVSANDVAARVVDLAAQVRAYNDRQTE